MSQMSRNLQLRRRHLVPCWVYSRRPPPSCCGRCRTPTVFGRHVRRARPSGGNPRQLSRVQRDYQGYRQGDPASVARWLRDCLERSRFPATSDSLTSIEYEPQSNQLVINLTLPTLDLVPSATAFKYVKASGEVAPVSRSIASRRQTYTSLIAQVTLRALHECFLDDVDEHVECIVLNGFVDTIDLATGHAVSPCLVTVRVTRERFDSLQLGNVDPDRLSSVIARGGVEKPERTCARASHRHARHA